MSNPSYFAANYANDSWQIYTMNSQKQYIDGVSAGLIASPLLVGVNSVITVISLEQPYVGRSNYLQIGIIPGTDLTSNALFDVYFPDLFATQQTGANGTTAFVMIGQPLGMQCSFTLYPSGYIQKATLSRPCPNQCSAQNPYFYSIPIKNRGDTLPVNGTWQVIVRYPQIDVGMGSLSNPLRLSPETISTFSLSNGGQNTIDQQTSLSVTVKPVNTVPTGSQRGRIRVILPAQITVLPSATCSLKINGVSSSGSTC